MNLTVIQTMALVVRENGTYAPFSGEAFQYAGEMTLLGMGMVFTVLALLWGVLSIFKLVFADKTEKTSKKTAEKVVATSVPVAEEASSDATAEADDLALIAVLTAAIAAYRSEEGLPESGFRVVSFKRAGGRAWNAKK